MLFAYHFSSDHQMYVPLTFRIMQMKHRVCDWIKNSNSSIFEKMKMEFISFDFDVCELRSSIQVNQLNTQISCTKHQIKFSPFFHSYHCRSSFVHCLMPARSNESDCIPVQHVQHAHTHRSFLLLYTVSTSLESVSSPAFTFTVVHCSPFTL